MAGGWKAALAGLAVAFAAPAHAAWREASSDHFLIYADSAEGWLRDFAGRLEKFDSGMRVLRGMHADPGAKSNRMTIYVVPSATQVNRLCGKSCTNVAGFYVPRVGGSVAFTARNAGGEDFGADVVLFHEYTHHFLLENYAAAYPGWFNEGFAEFNATARFERNGAIDFGVAAQHRAFGLFHLHAIPIEMLLDPGPKRLDPEETESFYGRAWLLVHMLLFDDARKGQLPRYLTLFQAGTPSLEAARTAFGDLKKLDRDLDHYLMQRISYVRLPADKLHAGTITLRSLSEGEGACMSTRMRSDRGVDHAAALAVVKDAEKCAGDYPHDPAAQSELAEAEYDAGNDAAADAAADRALAADAKRRDALLYKGRVAMRRAQQAHSTDPKVWSAARGWFVKANHIDPDAAEPLLLFYTSFVEAGEKPTASAENGLLRAFELSPQDAGLRMLLARQLLRYGKLAEARVVLLPLAYDPHLRGEDNVAAKAIAAIDQGASGKDALGALGTAPKDDQPGP